MGNISPSALAFKRQQDEELKKQKRRLRSNRRALALLKGDFRPSTVLALSPDSPYRLQDVYVAGYPFGRRISTDVKITKGVISSLTGIANNFSRIQIDAALQPGNSGGLERQDVPEAIDL